jgi:crotonobetainyl-CoA:carnitine CoA-transferase CaiB-like acyl-CoA transferase
VSAVHDLDAARRDPLLAAAGLVERTPMPEGDPIASPGPFLPSLGRTPERPAPRLGEHTDALVAELELDG